MQQRIQEMTWIKSDTYALVINPDETITIGFIDKK
jgi:hypothetical protein